MWPVALRRLSVRRAPWHRAAPPHVPGWWRKLGWRGCAEPGLCVCPEQATLLSDGTYGLQANIFRARGYCLVLSQHTICVQYQYSVLAQSRNADCMLISGPVLLLKALKFPGNFPQEKEILSFRTSAPQVCTPHLSSEQGCTCMFNVSAWHAGPKRRVSALALFPRTESKHATSSDRRATTPSHKLPYKPSPKIRN